MKYIKAIFIPPLILAGWCALCYGITWLVEYHLFWLLGAIGLIIWAAVSAMYYEHSQRYIP
jgi:hypothetical protein